MITDLLGERTASMSRDRGRIPTGRVVCQHIPMRVRVASQQLLRRHRRLETIGTESNA
jgi:hypothetical protein